MDRAHSVLVVGTGIAGLSAAVALTRHGISVDVIEPQQPEGPEPVSGAPLPGNAVAALSQLGILDACVETGYPCGAVCLQDMQGSSLDCDWGVAPEASPSAPAALGISYPSLREILAQAALASGARLLAGTTVSDLTLEDDLPRVRFGHGESSEYALIVGADGVDSNVRRLTFGQRPSPRATGQVLWSCRVARPEDLLRPILVTVQPGGMVGLVPISHSEAYVFLVASGPPSQGPGPEHFATLLRTRLEPCAGPIASVCRRIERPMGPVACRPIRSIFMPRPWHRDNVLLIGDAAHTFPPHLGQSAAQALLDAVLLGELLRSREPIAPMLEEFMLQRYERCKLIYDASIQLCVWERDPAARPEVLQLIRRLNSQLGRLVD